MILRPARGMVRRCALFVAVAAVPSTAFAGTPASAEARSEGFDISGSFRVRGEALDGQFRPGKAQDDSLLLLRTALRASYTTGPVQIVGELMDARTYGQHPDSPIGTGEVNTLEPLQAYVALDLGPVLGAGSRMQAKAGRFTMDLGSSRLVTRADYANFPNAFTGAKVDLTTASGGEVELFWTMPDTRLPNDQRALQGNTTKFDRSTTDLQFYGAHLTHPLFAGVQGELYAYQLNEQDAERFPSRDRHILTYGTRFSRAPAPGALDFDIEYARQSGTARASSASADTVDCDTEASFLHAEAGHTFAGGWRTRLSAHYDFASGDRPGADYNRFDSLFGGRRDFGPTGVYGPAGWSNIISGGIRAEARPTPRLDVMGMYRALWLDEATDAFSFSGVRDASGASGTWAGHQAELRIRYWLKPNRLRLEAGAAYLAKGRFLRNAPNAPASGDTRFAYLSLSASL